MKGLCLIIWMILTLALVVSVIGLLLLAPDRYDDAPNIPSTWMMIGKSLLASVNDY